MKLADLPQAVLDDLCQEDQWRLDIDPGFDSKHEFWMAWHHFLKIPDESYYPRTEDSLADFITVDEYDLLGSGNDSYKKEPFAKIRHH